LWLGVVKVRPKPQFREKTIHAIMPPNHSKKI
jgi:hypothetical protein